MRRLLLVLLGLLVLVCVAACGPSRTPSSRAPQHAPSDGGVASSSSGAAVDVVVPTLDALASRGAADAPDMREVLRVADAANAKTDIKALSGDACVRAIVSSSAPIRVWFEDDAHAPRGDVAASASSPSTSLVPPHGPACARKGETLHLIVEAGATKATSRAVVWQAP